MAGINHLPGLFNFLLKGHDSLLVLLTELKSCLNFCCIAHDFCVELSTLSDQPLFIVCIHSSRGLWCGAEVGVAQAVQAINQAVHRHKHISELSAAQAPRQLLHQLAMRLLQCPVQFIILDAETFQPFVTGKLL